MTGRKISGAGGVREPCDRRLGTRSRNPVKCRIHIMRYDNRYGRRLSLRKYKMAGAGKRVLASVLTEAQVDHVDTDVNRHP